ncbi:protein of unknown function [Nitrospina watsonii]|uniref:Uncharacterized protein n=1 Tax=Nitrospina watsonii TaxID=1323948 RepID=A0ABM9HBY4_9BACT|nr:protein of unknown function [Nitrospina watsonii]
MKIKAIIKCPEKSTVKRGLSRPNLDDSFWDWLQGSGKIEG